MWGETFAKTDSYRICIIDHILVMRVYLLLSYCLWIHVIFNKIIGIVDTSLILLILILDLVF